MQTISRFEKDPYNAYQNFLYNRTINGLSIYSSDCLLYTSDAADERSSVDLGGSRIIKKKEKKK